jgi:hypothetical protein
MKAAICFVLMIIILSACSTLKYIPVIETKTEYTDRFYRDSIYIRDSFYIKETNSNDTVWITEYRDRYIYKYINKIDSFILTDSIPYPVTIYADKIIYKRSFWDTVQIW